MSTGPTEQLTISDIQREEALICRAKGINRRTVAEYAAAMTAGQPFPPVVVFRNAKGAWLADGFHRTGAAELNGQTTIEAVVHEGGRKEALLHAAGANAAHGLRRTNADKRRAVLLVLEAFPKLSDRQIAERCGVDNKTVAAAKRRTEPGEEIPQPDAPALPTDPVSRLPLVLDRAAKLCATVSAEVEAVAPMLEAAFVAMFPEGDRQAFAAWATEHATAQGLAVLDAVAAVRRLESLFEHGAPKRPLRTRRQARAESEQARAESEGAGV